jgi:hypothetical protein
MPILNTFTSAAARAFKSVVSSVIDPFFSSVGLLLHGDLFGTTNQNNTFLDSSSNNLGITNTSVVQGSFSPYSPSGNYNPTTQGGSGYFNGSSQLFIASNSQTAVESGDFTIEAWIYFTSNATVQCIYQNSATFTTNSIYFGEHQVAVPGSGMTFWLRNFAPSGPLLAEPTPIPDNQWTHFAVTRSGNTFRLFRNGVQTVSATFSGAATGATNECYIGTQGIQGSSVTGYLSGFRIVKGTAVYTSNFTPPTSPVGNIAGTGLLLNFANAAAYDASAKTNVATLVNAAVSSVQKKFGTGSLYVDGSSYFSYLDSASTSLGSGDFTIEFWVYKTSAAAQFTRILQTPNLFIQDSMAPFNGIRFFEPGNLSGTALFQVSNPTLNTWDHYAFTRQGNTFRGFKNGVLQATATSSGTSSNAGTSYIGIRAELTEAFTGYFDEFRITKGVARYTASFTPPDAPFPNS